jgi:hypothetical protein
MLLETAQLLCSPFEPGTAPYKRTHYNHPCAKWARERSENYWWLLKHGHALGMEYNKRYGRMHKSYSVISDCLDNWDKLKLARPWPEGVSPFVQCMPEKYKVPDNPVQAYRNYYLGDKIRFAKWEKGTQMPDWFFKGLLNELINDPNKVVEL